MSETEDQYENYTYVITVRETVDTQYIMRINTPLSDKARENLPISFDTFLQLGISREAALARNVREREIVDVTFTGRQLKEAENA